MPATEEVKKFLTLKFREMVKAGRKTTFVQRSEPLYRVITKSDGQEALQTYQGLWRETQEHLQKKRRSVQVLDLCMPMTPPNIEAAMRGLTLSQQALLRHALEQEMSGLIGAPTRYGKTYLMAGVCRAYNGKRIVVTAPGIDLCQQIEADLKKILPDRDIRGIYTGSKHRSQGPDITVCSIDSMERCDAGLTDVLLIDEPHAMVADGRLPMIHRFYRARKIGFGATLDGRFDKKDRLISALIGPVLANKTYLEAVAEGSISPLKVVFIKVPFSKDSVPGRCDRETTWKRLLTQSSKLAGIAKTLCNECIPRDWQTMLFIKDEKQADYLFVEAMDPTCSVAMAKKLKPKPRKEMTARIAANEISRILASNIYVQGVTFPDLKVVINMASGGATTSAIQKPGRLLQKRKGKNYGVMVDLLFECTDADDDDRSNPAYQALIGECWARHKAYEKIGYDIIIAKGINHLKEIVDGAYDKEAA
jgi:superfamily II DNA or RNA helicase